MQIEVLSDSRVLFIERQGDVKIFHPATEKTTSVGHIPVAVFGEVGLMGLACDLAFDDNGWIYLLHCPKDQPSSIRLSRFTLADAGLDPDSEVKLLDYRIETDGAIHMGGGLYLDRKGNLHVGTGDNCPPIPELPVDQRPGRENDDALRTSANSMDLRGKVLRIHPEPDGTYSIPDGNLFSDRGVGRPEIYAMGCRNPFRLSVDEGNGCVYWGDVGPNIDLTLQLGPNGYDEINRASVAGNFGWPMFVGPNEAYRNFDFARRVAGDPFTVERPVNHSRNNTGIRVLPAPKPAMIWYPSGESIRFPTLGSGGRSAMAGPVYRFDDYPDSPIKLPKRFDGSLFIYEWTRNWIRTVRMDEAGGLTEITPFMNDQLFRKPIDMEIGPDGTLYIVEYGDKWGDNRDAQITRVVYRRGNRKPIVKMAATQTAGRHPLEVELDASMSLDPDANDALSYRWEIDGRARPGVEGARARFTFDTPGTYRVTVNAIDPFGLSDSATEEIRVGNSVPSIAIETPASGSFFDWDDTIRYRITARDMEDGSTLDGSIPSGRVLLNRQVFSRRPSDSIEEVIDPGLKLMRETTCFSCHTTKSKSAGPPYFEVGKRYANDVKARERLANKIINGGAGTWGSKPMPPHPQHSLEQTRLMVDWILGLAENQSHAALPGRHGFFRADTLSKNRTESGVLRLNAEYTDNGAEDAPSIRVVTSCVLHTRRKRASSFDRRDGIELVDVFERQEGLVARFSPGDWIAFRDVNLSEIDRITWRAAAPAGSTAAFTLRVDSPQGRQLADLVLPGKSDELGDLFQQVTTTVRDPGGLHDLYVVANSGADATTPTRTDSPQSSEIGARKSSLAWIEFHDSPAAERRKRKLESQRKKIVLIPTKLDHPWATHMYTDVCRILAACLNEHPDVEAIVSPDMDWPRDERLISEADAIVYYSRPAGDIVLSPQHRDRTRELMRRGVGFSAIHWATGAEAGVGEEYREILGGWFNFAHSGLKVDRRPLVQTQPDHAVCRGWTSYLLRDEFYLNLKFSQRAEPVLTVNVDGADQTVAWVLERTDGGRSFGTTLGHFHDNYSHAPFRQMIVNGILWTANVEVPESGSAVDVDRAFLSLPEKQREVVREWKLSDLRSLLDQPLRDRSFSQGEHLFQVAACASCHSIDGNGGKLGPDLAKIRVRLAENSAPRLALLRELVEPSYRVEPEYRTNTFLLNNGQVVSGIVKGHTGDRLSIASNPEKPNELTQVAVDQIEQRSASDVSMMPSGLLNTLREDEILDLIAYVESGGQSDYIAFQPIRRSIEPWANHELPIQSGLQWWLDASRINAARDAAGTPSIVDGAALGRWPDASGYGRHARQRSVTGQPVFRDDQDGACVVFDGVDDLLTAVETDLKTRDFSAFVVVRMFHNRGWPGLISGNAFDRNDFQSGLNLDLMPEPTELFSSLMVEGPGFIGVTNLMRDALPLDQFHVITVSSRPGRESVRLRVNGRPQGARDRSESSLQIDELTVAARIWSNDPGQPPFNRGFLAGAFAQVLLYDRVLSEAETTAVEAWLWDNTSVLGGKKRGD